MKQLSKLLLQVYVDRVEFKTTVENIIQNRFVNQEPININGFELVIKEFEGFDVQIMDNTLAYQFIVKLKISSSTISGVDGMAKIRLTLNSKFNISEDWQFQTKTFLKDHEWIEKPVMKLKIISIPSTGILELLIGAFDDKMCSEIDKLIEKGSDIQKILKPVLANLKNPLQIDKINNFNFHINPSSLKIHLDDYSDKYIRIKIVSEAGLEAKIKTIESTEIIAALPKIHFEDFENNASELFIQAEISHQELSRILVAELKEIDLKGKKVNFEAIDIKTQGNLLDLKIDLKGDLSGTVFLNFEPIFDKEKQFLALKDLQFKLESNQLLVKASSWIFKKEIERQLAKYAKVDLEQVFNSIKFSTNKKLENFELSPGLYFTAYIDDIKIDALSLLPEGLSLDLKINSDFSAQIRMQKSLTQS